MSFIFKTLRRARGRHQAQHDRLPDLQRPHRERQPEERRHRGTDAGRHDDSGQVKPAPAGRAGDTVDSTAPAPDHVRHPPSRLRTLLAHAAAAGRGSPHGHLSRSCVRPHWHDAYTIPVILEGAGASPIAAAAMSPKPAPCPSSIPARCIRGRARRRRLVLSRQLHAGRIHPRTHLFDRRPPAGRAVVCADVIRDADLAARLTLAHRMMEAGSERALPLQTHGQPAHDPTTGAPRVYDPLAAETAMLDALSTLIVRHADAQPRPAPLAADEPRVDVMRERLAADLVCTVTLDEVAQAAGLSPFHAARLFTRTTGMPPHAWRNQLRLQRALAPLRAGVPVADVAAASGSSTKATSPGISNACSACRPGAGRQADAQRPARHRDTAGIPIRQAQEHTSRHTPARYPPVHGGAPFESDTRIACPPPIERMARRCARHDPDDDRRRPVRRDFRHARGRRPARRLAWRADVARRVRGPRSSSRSA